MKYPIEKDASDDEASICERGDGSSVETASLTKEPSLASSASNDTLDDCNHASPEIIKGLRLRRGGFYSPFPARCEISVSEELLHLERGMFLHDSIPTSPLRKVRNSGKYLIAALLWFFFFGFFSVMESFRRPQQWHIPSRRLVKKIDKRSAKVGDKDAGLTIRLTGSRINLLHQSLEIYGRCDKVQQIQIDWTSVDESFPHGVVSHDSNKIVPVTAAKKFVTDAVLLLDESVRLTCEDIERAFQQWKLDPSRIVGFLPDNDQAFSQLSDQAALVHRHYLSRRPPRLVDGPCDLFSLSVFITTVSGKGPVVMTSDLLHGRRYTIEGECLSLLSFAAGIPLVAPAAIRYIGR